LADDSQVRSSCKSYLAELAKVRPEPRALLRERLPDAETARARVRGAQALLQIDAADHEALQALVKAREDAAGSLDEEILNPWQVAGYFLVASQEDQIALLRMLAHIGPAARGELRWLQTVRNKVEPKLVPFIEGAQLAIRGFDD